MLLQELSARRLHFKGRLLQESEDHSEERTLIVGQDSSQLVVGSSS